MVAVADAAVGRAVGAMAVMAQHAEQLRLLLLQQRHPRAVVAAVVVEAVAPETMRQQQ